MPALVRILSLPAALGLLSALALPRGVPAERADADLVLERFQVAREADFLTVPVTVGGKTYPFVLDTGSTNTAYDLSLQEALGRPLRAIELKTAMGAKTVNVFRSPKARLGSLDLAAGEEVIGVDLAFLRQVSGQDVYGIVGMDFLYKHILRIDLDRGRIDLMKSVPATPGHPVDFFWGPGRVPVIEADVAGLGAKEFRVDTARGGFGSGELRTALLEGLVAKGKCMVAGEANATGVKGSLVSRIGKLDGFTLGRHTHRGLYFGESERNLLGLGYLSRFVVTFDFPGGRMYLAKGRHFDRPDPLDMSGLHLLRIDGEVVVHSVDKGSPAAASSIRPGDVILDFRDRRLPPLPLRSLRLTLSEEGAEVNLTVIRGRERLPVSLRLKNWRQVGNRSREGLSP